MKFQLLYLTAALATALMLVFGFVNMEGSVSPDMRRAEEYKRRTNASCSPDWNELKEWIDDSDIPPLPGTGAHRWKISTHSDSALFYFNQGINSYYGFHIIEAMASFKKAARFDSTAAMVYWGQALAYGPNINDLGYAASPDALQSVNRALALSANATTTEKILIQAQSTRYSPDSNAKREALNQLYADRMKEAYRQFNKDPDIGTLYADALMLQHPWDLWKANGSPRQWTPRIREVLEDVLALSPDHPGANHYYIHVMEPSPFASKALPSAERLGRLSPGLSHLVHMPSHIYLRTGNYTRGVEVNDQAVTAYQNYLGLYAPVAANDFLYIIHNLHMKANNAMMAGQSAAAVRAANETVKSIPGDYMKMQGALGNYLQYIYMTPVLVHVRFGHWNDLMTMAQPDSSMVYANVLFHFGRGMALAQQGKAREARQELEKMEVLMTDESLGVPLSPFSSALDGATVAAKMLTGSILVAEKKFVEAADAYLAAVKVEENMIYNEPRDWLLNPRHYLGNACLKLGKWEDARQVFLEDLKANEENGWALFGLYQALTTGNRKSDGEKVYERYRKAFALTDTELHSPVF